MDEQDDIHMRRATCDAHDGDADAAETVFFRAEGQGYECRLCADHLAEFRHAMGTWTAHARPRRLPGGRRAESRARKRGNKRRFGQGTSGARTAPVQERARHRFERMLDVADELFEERGIEGTTTTLIAERADTSIGSIYNFVGDKYAIARALSARYAADVTSAFDDLARNVGDLNVLADGLVDLVATLYRRHRGLAPLLVSRGASEDLRLAREAVLASLIELIERLVALRGRSAIAGRRREVADMCARILWSVVGEVVQRPDDERETGLVELQVALTTYLSVTLGHTPHQTVIGRRAS